MFESHSTYCIEKILKLQDKNNAVPESKPIDEKRLIAEYESLKDVINMSLS